MIDVATLAAALALVKASGGGGSGEPGFSPTVEIAEVEGGTQVTITDVNGPQTFTVLNGTNGTNGVNGQDGQDGVSPVLSIGEVTTLAAGSQATASLGGTAANPTLNLGIPQGAQGAQGAPGLDAPQIDDTQITTTNPWSSMQIVKTLCPPFTVSGATVQCTPVANYPLGVKVAWEPRQEGEGDPSPENVRPIVGLDSVQVTQCGKNFMPYSKPSPSTYTKNGITFTWNDDGSIHVSGTAVGNADSNVMNFDGFYLPPGTYRMIPSSQSGVVPQFVVKKGSTGTNIWYTPMNVSIENGDVPQYFYVHVNEGATVDTTIYAFLSHGSETPSVEDYAPYTGTTATLTLPETIYGGTVDAVTGEGSEEWFTAILTGNETWMAWGANYPNSFFTDIEGHKNLANDAINVFCSNFLFDVWDGRYTPYHFFSQNPGTFPDNVRLCFTFDETVTNIDLAKQWIAAQYTAGTPVTICYKLATPQPIQATGGQSIPALSGTNTIYADAGNITVTGASDPIATITALQNRVSALENAALN